MGNPCVLIVIPLMDIPTIISTIGASELTKAARPKWDPIVLFGVGATQLALWGSLFNQDIRAIFYMGHGDETSLIGNDIIFRLIKRDWNEQWMKDKIVWTMACLSGLQLGPAAVKAGCRAYFGHRTFYYAAFQESEHDYMADWIDYVTSAPRALMEGKTCKEALQIYKNTCRSYIDLYQKMRAANPDSGAGWYVDHTLDNMDYFELLGDLDATL